MNSGVHSEPRPEAAPTTGAAVDDVLYTLFRHKWLILSFVTLGLAAAGVVRLLKPPLYQSEAKIQVKYVMQTTGVNPTGPETQVVTPGFSGQEIMDAEVEIIRSLDTALLVATNVGPEKILAEKGGGNHPMVAASVVRQGLTVPPPRSATIAITFKHPDPDVVQPVLDALIKAYMRRHAEMRTGRGMAEVFAQDRDELGRRIAEMDAELKKLKFEAEVPDLDEAKKAFQLHTSKLQSELFDAESRLAEREALYGEWLHDSTNVTTLVVPIEVADEYRTVAKRIDEIKRTIRTRLETVTVYHPDVIRMNTQVKEFSARLKELETLYPNIAGLSAPSGTIGVSGTNDTPVNISASLADIKLLKRVVDGISNRLALAKAEQFRLMDFERQITELERRRDVEKKNYQSIQNNLDQARQDDSNHSSRVTGMYLTESPTPAGPDMKKLIKMAGMAFGGCVAIGIGLAFLIDMILDRTIRRRQDVTRHLHLPVFLIIPDTNWKGRLHFPWLLANGHAKRVLPDDGADEPAAPAPTMAVAEWNPTNHLQSHVEGLRERLITHFEVYNVNHKPKLVGLTSCDHGAGVTTLASGLAAALSKTGDGSALLVDMNTPDGRTHSFYRGKPGCGPSETIEQEPDAPLNSTMSLTSVSPEQRKHDRLAKLLPPSFNHLVPKLKATEYDYIVFDMPRVSPRSVTARLSGQMDIVLMVIESERTGQQRAVRAMALMREARASMAAVLNKCRNYVPARLAND
jgi:succinoglycan biosynthesis transport protein ExoP